jgi:hypothetical protein
MHRRHHVTDRLPPFLHQLSVFDKLGVAMIRTGAGIEIPYGDIKGAVDQAGRLGIERNAPFQELIRIARAIDGARKFIGVAYLGFSAAPYELGRWIAEVEIGLAISDTFFLRGWTNRYSALRHGSDLLVRLLSCSGVKVRNSAKILFNPGERFIIVRAERRDYGRAFGKFWTVDAEEMYWRKPHFPGWPEQKQ